MGRFFPFLLFVNTPFYSYYLYWDTLYILFRWVRDELQLEWWLPAWLKISCMGIIRARSTSLDRFVFIFLGGRGRGGLFYFEGKLSCVFELKILDEFFKCFIFWRIFFLQSVFIFNCKIQKKVSFSETLYLIRFLNFIILYTWKHYINLISAEQNLTH